MRSVLVVSLLIAISGCGRSAEMPASNPGAWQSVSTPATNDELVLRKLEAAAAPHLHNVLQLTARIYSGSEPRGEKAFADLARLGVKVVVSVDGAKPDIHAAKKHGLRYVHIPIGYDGIPDEAGLALARVVRETGAAGEHIYFHCHHGKHRGPAAAAVACIAAEAADQSDAKKILTAAGTSKEYAGLWRDVADYRPPLASTAVPELVEAAEVNSIAAAMSTIDRAFDNLRLCQSVDWKVPTAHPDIVAAREALILKESLHETGRNPPRAYDEEFVSSLHEAEALAAQLESELKSNDPAAATQSLLRLDAACQRCHSRHRNVSAAVQISPFPHLTPISAAL